LGKKETGKSKGKSILNPKTKEHTTTTAKRTTARQNPKIDSFRPHPHTAERDLMRTRSKVHNPFYKGTTTHNVKKTQRREANSGQQ
jgi:hypothetical protein